jgi:hypothetical protein
VGGSLLGSRASSNYKRIGKLGFQKSFECTILACVAAKNTITSAMRNLFKWSICNAFSLPKTIRRGLILLEREMRTKSQIKAIQKAREISKRVTARRVRSYKPIVFLSNPK